jgi:hypothetical protein
MIFGRRKPAPFPQATHMGFRSRPVLEKLGFDLRELRERYGKPMQDLPSTWEASPSDWIGASTTVGETAMEGARPRTV